MPLSQGTATRGEMITQALQRVANASRDLKAQARIRLNRILSDLYMGWDWPFLFVDADVSLAPGGQFILPADFIKPVDPWGLRITRDPMGNAVTMRVRQVDPMAFVSLGVPPGQPGTYPTIWTLDLATQLGKYWPNPQQSLLGTLRYKRQPPDLPTSDTATYDSDIPIFPWSNFLTDTLLAWAMEYENDFRATQQKADNEQMFMRIRAATFPPATAAFTTGMGLDPDIFSTPFGGNEGGGNWPAR